MTSTIQQIDFEETIKHGDIQLSVLKDYIKDKNKKILLLSIVNIILTFLLIFLLCFTVTTQKFNFQSQTAEKVITELNSVQTTEIKAENQFQTDRSKNVLRNKKDK